MKKLIITQILSYVVCVAMAQTIYPKNIESQIKQVENNLAGRLIIDGKPYNILNRMKHYKVKGLSMAVVQNYKVVWAKGYGWADEKARRPVTTSTLFKPGSISKSLNAVGVLKLAQDHKLNLYNDINEYLKSWQFPYDSLSKGKKITVAQLLSHTAGLSVYGGFPGYGTKDKTPSLAQVLSGIVPANTPAVRSLFEPGLKFQYSGGGTLISQLIITDLSRQSYEQYIYNTVLKPLGMSQSFFSTFAPRGARAKLLATPYTGEGLEVASKYNVYPEQAAMGLWTNPTELANYMIESQMAYEGKSAKVLNREMAKLHLTPYIDGSSAMGVFIGERNKVKYFFHDAGNEGFRGLFYGSVEDGNGMVVFVNSDNGEIILELLNSVASVYHWGGFDKPETVYTKGIAKPLAKQYVGLYFYEGLIAEVIQKPDGLYFWTGNQEAKMYFTSDRDFINIEYLAEKSFITNELGQVSGFSRKANGIEFPPAKKVQHLDTLNVNDGQLNNYGWRLLETKRFEEAISCLTRGIALEPQDIAAKANLAHSYLFGHHFDKAMQMYKTYFAQKPEDEGTLKNMLKQDFAFFKKNGFDKIVIDKAILALKL